MRAKPAPSSLRAAQKTVQSTTSCSFPVHSSTPPSLGAAGKGPVDVSAFAVERVLRAAQGETDRHRAEAELAPHPVHPIAAIAVRKRLEAASEDDDARRPRPHLGDVPELDPPPRRR